MLLALEGFLVTLAGIALGAATLVDDGTALAPWLQSAFGLRLAFGAPTALQGWCVLGLLVAGWLASLLPGWRAYRMSLADGLSPRI